MVIFAEKSLEKTNEDKKRKMLCQERYAGDSQKRPAGNGEALLCAAIRFIVHPRAGHAFFACTGTPPIPVL